MGNSGRNHIASDIPLLVADVEENQQKQQQQELLMFNYSSVHS